MTTERDAVGIQLAKIQLQLRDRERELADLRELRTCEMEQSEVIKEDKDKLLTAVEIQKSEFAVCQKNLRTQIAGLKQALEQEHQAAREAVRKLEYFGLMLGTFVKGL